MRYHHLLPDFMSYYSGISACETRGQWQRALGLLLKMSFVSEIISYSSGISACEEGGQWKFAWQATQWFVAKRHQLQ